MFGELHRGGFRHEAQQHEARKRQFHQGNAQGSRFNEIFVFDQPEDGRPRLTEERSNTREWGNQN